MIALPSRPTFPRLTGVIASPPASVALFIRTRFVTLVLVTLGLFGTMMLASWHDARPHVHDVATAVHGAQPGDHDSDGQPQPDDPMHAAAHVVLQGMSMPAEPVIAGAFPVTAIVGSAYAPAAMHSILPPSILRPPRV